MSHFAFLPLPPNVPIKVRGTCVLCSGGDGIHIPHEWLAVVAAILAARSRSLSILINV